MLVGIDNLFLGARRSGAGSYFKPHGLFKAMVPDVTIHQAVEIVNAGAPGIGLTRSRWICRAYRDQFDADMVIIGLYTDDLLQAAVRSQELTGAAQLVNELWPILGRIRMNVIAGDRFGSVSPGATILTSPVWARKVKEHLSDNPALLLRLDPKLRSPYLSGKIAPFVVSGSFNQPRLFTLILDDAPQEAMLDALQGRLQKLKQRCLTSIPTLVVLLPGSAFVDASYLPSLAQLGYEVDQRLTTLDLDALVEPLVREQGFSYATPLSPFRRDGCQDCYFPIDGHLTATGHERVATEVAPIVSSMTSEFP